MPREQEYMPFSALHARLKSGVSGNLNGEANAEPNAALNVGLDGEPNGELNGRQNSELDGGLNFEPYVKPNDGPNGRLSTGPFGGLPEPVLDGYQWFDQANREAAYAALQGSQSAAEYGLDVQADIYQKKALATLVFDGGQRALTLAGLDFHRDGWRLLQHPNVPQGGFTVDVEAYIRDDGQYYKKSWAFTEAANVGNKLIPPQALQVLASFRGHVTPDRIWLVEVRETIGAVQVAGDPLLCVSIGQWIVPITYWK